MKLELCKKYGCSKYKRLIGFLVFFTNSVWASEINLSGQISTEGRYFINDPALEEQQAGNNLEFVFRPELDWKFDNSSIKFEGFLREGSDDESRNHVDVRELYWEGKGSDWDVSIGIKKIFWGTTESRHLVDIINQTDLVESINQEEKLGQSMVNFNLYREWGDISIFWLPYFRERTFPGIEGRQRTPLYVHEDEVLYESKQEENHEDYAIRYSHYWESLDFGFYFFEGTSREPELLLSEDNLYLQAYYRQIKQAGLDLQYTGDGWLAKLELIHQENNDESYLAYVAGIEYSFYQAFRSSADVGLIVEYLNSGKRLYQEELFDDDLFLGVRLALNDVSDTTVLLGNYIDVDNEDHMFVVEAETRLGSSLTAQLALELFDAKDGVLTPLTHDDLIKLTLGWHF